MMMTPDSATPLTFHNESGQPVPFGETRAREIAGRLITAEAPAGASLLELVYVDEAEILRINREYLQHDYVTDIITFSYHEPGAPVEATLFCCAPRISAQAAELDQPETAEFERVLIHGLLHACGYEDGTPAQKARMTRREDHYLSSSGGPA
ncbi:MAG: rRNA maturation RNase YbeY [Cyclonatronaceae bacterium]